MAGRHLNAGTRAEPRASAASSSIANTSSAATPVARRQLAWVRRRHHAQSIRSPCCHCRKGKARVDRAVDTNRQHWLSVPTPPSASAARLAPPTAVLHWTTDHGRVPSFSKSSFTLFVPLYLSRCLSLPSAGCQHAVSRPLACRPRTWGSREPCKQTCHRCPRHWTAPQWLSTRDAVSNTSTPPPSTPPSAPAVGKHCQHPLHSRHHPHGCHQGSPSKPTSFRCASSSSPHRF